MHKLGKLANCFSVWVCVSQFHSFVFVFRCFTFHTFLVMIMRSSIKSPTAYLSQFHLRSKLNDTWTWFDFFAVHLLTVCIFFLQNVFMKYVEAPVVETPSTCYKWPVRPFFNSAALLLACISVSVQTLPVRDERYRHSTDDDKSNTSIRGVRISA